MTKTIQQTVEFEGVSPNELFETYIQSKKHSAATNNKASISRKVGARWTAFNGHLHGKNLAIIPNRMIVQSWRAGPWKEEDLDSVVVLKFSEDSRGAVIDLVHAFIPDHAYAQVNENAWHEHYWNPWREYLRGKSGRD